MHAVQLRRDIYNVPFLELRTGEEYSNFENLGSGLSGWEVWNFLGIFGLLCFKLQTQYSLHILLGLSPRVFKITYGIFS